MRTSCELSVRFDLREKRLGLRPEGEQLPFPRIERLRAPVIDLIEPDAPKQAEKVIGGAGGQKAAEFARAADTLPEHLRIKLRRALSDEPQRAPRVAAEACGDAALLPQHGFGPIADEQEVKRAVR